MRKALLAVVLGLLTTNCAGVTSGQPTTGSVSGDAWYTKDRYLLARILTTDSDIYWCAKETPTKCVKAELKE
jgi:hypothetical protein